MEATAHGERQGMRMSMSVHDDPSSVAEVRAAVETVAARQGLSPQAVFDLKVATTEAVANALRSTPDGSPDIDVTLDSDQEVVQVEVRDHGRFQIDPSLDPERGRGLPLMIALADEVEFAASGAGTRVCIRMRVGRDSVEN